MSIQSQISNLKAELFLVYTKEEKDAIKEQINKLELLQWQQDEHFVSIDEQYQIN
jgi:hypothetical protein